MSVVVLPSRMHNPHPVKVVFLGESPGREEAEQGHAFVGRSGKLLRQFIKEYLDGTGVLLTNVCPEYLHGGKPDTKGLKEWRSSWVDLIKHYEPKVIVALGEYPMKAMGLGTGPVTKCGKTSTWEGRRVVISVHPAFCLRNPKKLDLLDNAMKAVRVCLKRESSRNIKRIKNIRELDSVLKETEKKLCAFDIETTSLDPRDGIVLCASLSDGKKTWWVGLHHQESWGCDTGLMLNLITRWWSKGPRIVHNAKFEGKWMKYLGSKRDPKVLYDTMLRAWLINENESKSLNWQVVHTLKKPPYWEAVEGEYTKVPLDVLGKYNAMDSKMTYNLYRVQKLTTEENDICQKILIPLTLLLAEMELTGVYVDEEQLDKFVVRTRATIDRQSRKLAKVHPFLNVSSPTQVSKLLFKDLGLKPVFRTDTGMPSTSDEVLTKLKQEHPSVKMISDIRKSRSLLNRGLLPWKKFIRDDDCIHAEFGVTNVVTGRLSCSNPNLQNLDRDGPRRKCLVSRFTAGKILQFDYKQHELRIMGATVGGPLLDRCRDPKCDLHQVTADELKCSRPIAKNCNFGLIYGVSANTLYQRYNIPVETGRKLRNKWFRIYPEVVDYHEWIKHCMREQGYVESIFGWKRRVWDTEDYHQINQGFNHPIQNAAVVICYMAMNEIRKLLHGMKSLLILQIHDSVVLDAWPTEVDRLEKEIPKLMKGVPYKKYCKGRLKHEIPLEVDVKIGESL